MDTEPASSAMPVVADSETRVATYVPGGLMVPPALAGCAWVDPTPPITMRKPLTGPAVIMVGCDYATRGVEVVQYVGWRGADGLVCANRLEGNRPADCAHKISWAASVYADGCEGWDLGSVVLPPWLCVKPPAVLTSWDGQTWDHMGTPPMVEVGRDVWFASWDW